MKIKIKALADIEFLSAKVDRKHNIIHVQARNLLDSTGQDCTFPTCSGGKYIAQVANTLLMALLRPFMKIFMWTDTEFSFI